MSLTVSSQPGAIGFASHAVHTAHLVGICGSGMKALAELLSDMGWKISGSDLHLTGETPQALAKRGMRLHEGHQGHFLPADAELLIYSPAINAGNPERQAAEERGLPQYSYTQMLGQLMLGKTGVSIAGTHGKSTTTAMTGCILTDAGYDPSVILGAEIRGKNRNGWGGYGPHFVAESCEFQRGFLDLTPTHAAILGIETDHFDCFRDLDATIAAFADFARRLPQHGALVVRDETAARRASEAAAVPVETFSLQPESDWWATDIRYVEDGSRFRIFRRGEYFTEISLRVPGEHNILNALAAAALTFHAGAQPEEIREGLNSFKGIKRRLEPIGNWRGVTLFDDYAHHPTAVRIALETIRRQFPDRRLWCVFQPHQVSRTRALMSDFATSFSSADEVVIVPVFAARERVRNEPVQTSEELATQIAAQGVAARFSPALDRAISTLDDDLRPGDVLVTMGAGDIGQVHHAFTQRLQRHYPPR